MRSVYGITDGINKNTLNEIETLYDYQVPKNQTGSEELFAKMLDLSQRINKEIAVYINRSGQIKLVAAGSRQSAELPFMTERRRDNVLTRLGCVHTHPSGSSALSDEDYNTLKNFNLDYICAIAETSGKINASLALAAFPGLAENENIYSFLSTEELLEIRYLDIIQDIEKGKKEEIFENIQDKETALLFIPYNTAGENSLAEQTEEFKKLAVSAGLEVLEIYTQNIKNYRTKIGKGKIEELRSAINKIRPDCLLIDAPLSPSLENSLSETLGLKIIDRTNLILDIFAQRAKSNEGKLQVELAQLKYLLPRIMGQGLSLSRLGGGVGTRGPGETKLETDRRHIRKRIENLEKQLDSVKKRRDIQKQSRIKKELPLVSLIGYTNSGKSSLLNTLSNDSIFAEDLLFATLDTTTRAVCFAETGNKILLTDTVGFISNIPHQLISAFKSTLEEVLEADLLLQVVDISNPNWTAHIKVVNQVLAEMNALDKDMIYVLNKVDAADQQNIPIQLDREYFLVSAKTKEGLSSLLKRIEEYFYNQVVLKILIPYSEPKLLALAYEYGDILEKEHLGEGTEILLKIDNKKAEIFKQYIKAR